MYNTEECLYYECWHKIIKDIPNTKFVRTCDFAGIVESPCVLITQAADFGVEYHEDDMFHWHILTQGHHNKSFTTLQPEIIKWFATNLGTLHERCEFLPIGVYDESAIEHINNNLGNEKTGLAYCNFADYSNPDHRKLIRKQCVQANVFTIKQGLMLDVYYEQLSSFKFAACPIGNGIDSYRIWECLYLETFPILQKNGFSSILAKDFPVLEVDDYSKLTTELLELEYNRLSKIEYKDKLKIKFWKDKIIKEASKI